MADRNRKEQLGARTRYGVRERAVAAALAAGVSFNEWIEKVILDALDIGPESIIPPVIEGQVSIEELAGEAVPALAGATGVARGGTTTGEEPPAPARPFAPDCSMRQYHWRCRPGNPCRRCGGEQ